MKVGMNLKSMNHYTFKIKPEFFSRSPPNIVAIAFSRYTYVESYETGLTTIILQYGCLGEKAGRSQLQPADGHQRSLLIGCLPSALYQPEPPRPEHLYRTLRLNFSLHAKKGFGTFFEARSVRYFQSFQNRQQF